MERRSEPRRREDPHAHEKRRDAGVAEPAGLHAQVLALQRLAGNRAVGHVLARQPQKTGDAETKLAKAPDPLDYDAFPDLWWWGVGPHLDAVPDEQQIRKILNDAGVVNVKVLADSRATLVKQGRSGRYYSFRHPNRGVVVRALVGRRLGLSNTGGGLLGVFTFGRQPKGQGGEALGAGESDSTEDVLKLVPPELRNALGGEKRFQKLKNADPEALQRIAEKLATLTADELTLWRGLDFFHTDDVSLMEQSVDAFIKYRGRVKPGTGTFKGEAKPGKDKPKPEAAEDESLEGQLKTTWKGFDNRKWRGMGHRARERTARDIRWEQTKTRLKYMANHPGETVKDMAKGVVRVDQLGKSVWKDIKEAASGDNNAYRRWAAGTGAAAKVSGWVAAVAGILFLALLIIPGVNVAVLATTALVAGATAIVLSEIESELRIMSAVEEDDPQKAREDIEASSAAHANFFLGAATMALGFAFKIIARTPIPGRLKTVGGALKAARSEISRVTGVGQAFEAVRKSLLTKLKGARGGMPELLKGQGDAAAQLASKIEAMDPQEFVNRLAKNDPALAELQGADVNGQKLSDVAQQIQELSSTGAGMDLPTKFKAQVVEGLKGASKTAAGEVGKYASDIDETIAAVEKAKDPAELQQAIKTAEGKLEPDAVAADADAQVRRIAEELAERENAAYQREIDIVESSGKDQPKQPPKPAPTPKKKVVKPKDPRQTVTDPSKGKQSGEPAPDKTKPATRDDPSDVKSGDPSPPAKLSEVQKLDQRIADLHGERAKLVEGHGSGDKRVRSRPELQAEELKARKDAAAKKRQLNATKDPKKRDQLETEHEAAVDKHADAEAELLNRQAAIDKIDLEIKKAQHPLKRAANDIAKSGKKADPPRDLPGRKIGGTPTQEAQMWADVEWALKQGAKDVRIDEFQVDIDGNYQGVNRPDVQYTLNNKRFYLEYEQLRNPRGRPHAERTITNDPKGTVLVKLVPTTPGFKPGQGVKVLTYTLDEIVSGAP